MPVSGYTAITIKDSDLKEIDAIAKEENITRPAVIRKAIEVYKAFKKVKYGGI